MIRTFSQTFINLLIEFLVSEFRSTMRLVILDTAVDVSEWAAKFVRNRIIQKKPGPGNYFVLGLPTGIYE